MKSGAASKQTCGGRKITTLIQLGRLQLSMPTKAADTAALLLLLLLL